MIKHRLFAFFFGFLCLAFESRAASHWVVVSGGYTSCGSSQKVQGSSPYGMGAYRPGMELVSKLKKKYGRDQVGYLFHCFGSDGPPEGRGKVVLSSQPEKVLSWKARQIASYLEKKLLEEADLKIHLIGHSYGGWLGMFLSEELSKYTIASLYTLDPISPETCGPLEYLFGSKGCHQAPQDRDEDLIAQTTTYWANFYQRQDSWLKSSPIKEADKNYKVTFRGPHGQIDSEQKVWAIIEKEILEEKSLSALQISKLFGGIKPKVTITEVPAQEVE